MHLSQLQEKRNTLHADMRGILDTATADNRNLSAEEAQRYDGIERDYDAVQADIARMTREEERSRVTLPDCLVNQFNYSGESRNPAILTKNDRMASRPSGLSLSKTIRAAILGDTRGAEEEVRALGIVSGGSTLITAELYNEVMDFARANTVAIQAGAITLPMHTQTLIVPRLTRDIVVGWRGENQLIGEDEPTFDGLTLVAKSLSGICRVSRELLSDSPVAEAAIRNSIGKAIGLALDHAVMWGSGTDPEPKGIANTSGVVKVSMGTNGLALSNFDPIIDAVAAIQAQNRTPNAYVMNPRDAAAMAKLKNTYGDYLEPPSAVTNLTPYTTTAESITETHGTATNSSSIVVGQFSEVAIGLREGIQVSPLVERYADYGQVAFVVHVRADVAVLDARAFAIVTGIIP